MKIFLQIKEIRQWLKLAERNPRDHALFHVAFSTGLRISDILTLRREDFIDADEAIIRTLRVKIRKTKKWIDRPLRADCRRSVERYLGLRVDDNPYMFPANRRDPKKNPFVISNWDQPMNRMTSHRLYKKYLRMLFPESMLARASTHTPRRSMAKIISEETGRIEPASKYLGHSSVQSTQTYIDMDSWEQKANEVVVELEIG